VPNVGRFALLMFAKIVVSRGLRMTEGGLESKFKVRLTSREREVMEILVEGTISESREIARELGVSKKAVENYLADIYLKLKVHNRIQAISEYHRLKRYGGIEY